MSSADISGRCHLNAFLFLYIYANKNADLHIQGEMFTFDFKDQK